MKNGAFLRVERKVGFEAAGEGVAGGGGFADERIALQGVADIADAPLGKYGDERVAHTYWWADPDAAADLDHAMKTGRALPAHPAQLKYVEALP